MDTLVPKNAPRPKLVDVARLAGVSIGTASSVLAGKSERHRISETTQERVLEAAKTLNYIPSLLHRSVREGRTNILSFFNSFRNRESGDLYMDRMTGEIEQAGGRYGYNILVHCRFSKDTRETYEFLNGGFSDGLILFAPAPDDPLLCLQRESDLPTVIVNPRDEEKTLSTVEDDAEAGIDLVVRNLVSLGHKRTAIVTQFSPGWPDPQKRERLLRQGLIDSGFSPHDVITFTLDASLPRNFDALLPEVLAISPRPSSIFFWNDRTAYDFLEACQRAGVSIPDTFSIVGYDGIVWPNPAGQVVASACAPFRGIADAAVGTLHRLINGEQGPVHVKVPGSFAMGTTLAPAR